MTMQPEKVVVADDVLGKVSRIVWDLTQRVIKGVVDPQRCMHILQLALEGVRARPVTCSVHGGGTYMLESSWAWDNSHLEYFTLELESMETGFELILDEVGCPQEVRRDMVARLKKVYEAQVPGHGSRKMRRLYRVYQRSRYGQTSRTAEETTRCVDLHFVMMPICDFDDMGKPIAVSDRFDRASD